MFHNKKLIEHMSQAKKGTSYQHIFLLSHMRANTSLISHILGSHPQISGYYEMHQSYRCENDLVKQEQLYSRKDSIKSSSHYLFDKLLHNKYELLPEKLDSKKIKILLSIRPPEQTIKSIINLFRNKKTNHPYAEPENATRYYIERIIALSEFCEHYKDRYYYFDADSIRIDPEKTLSRIQGWLSLATPLTEQYKLFSQTGEPGAGDSSANMKKGSIVKRPSDYTMIELPAQFRRKAEEENQKHKQLIVANSIDSIVL